MVTRDMAGDSLDPPFSCPNQCVHIELKTYHARRVEMKNKGILALVGIAVLLGLLMGSFACVTPKATPGPTPKITAKLTPSSKATANSLHVTADGRLSFVEDRSLTFGIDSGTVVHVNVRELDKVNKGQVLAKLDTTSMERAVKAAEIAVNAAGLTVNLAEGDRTRAESGVKSAEADLRQVQDNVKSAQIDLDQATDDFRMVTYPYAYSTFAFDVPQAVTFINEAQRQMNDVERMLHAQLTADQSAQVSRQLQDALDNLSRSNELLARGQGQDVFQSGMLNFKDFWTLRAAQLKMDKAQLALGSAQNVVYKTTLALDNARTALNNVQLAVDKAKYETDRHKTDLDRARDELDKEVITAPFDGVIAKLNVKEGDFLSANYLVYAIEIIIPSRMQLDINVDELDVLNIKLGQKVTITLDALPNKRFEGVVTSISPLPTAEAGLTAEAGVVSYASYKVKAVFDVPENLALKAGMTGTADITM